MKAETLDWIDKAEGDWHTMLRESEVIDQPNFDAVCFHAQQFAEKYLKARLVEEDIPFRKTHDLLSLLETALPIEPEWSIYKDLLSTLSAYGFAGRYPGLSASLINSEKAVQNCREIRLAFRRSLNLPAL